MIDIGVNLTNSRFNADRAAVIRRALLAGVRHIVVTGTNIEHSELAANFCRNMPHMLSCTAGVHPHDADQVDDNFIEQLQKLAQLPCVRAIGECGLDFNRNFSTAENQKRVFEQQLQLAAKVNLPLFLHQRDAFDTWLELLKPYLNKVPAVIAHCFTGDQQQAEILVKNDIYIGITGWICDDKRGRALQHAVKQIPLELLLIETDAPYLLPKSMANPPKSKRNEPSFLPEVVAKIAEITGYSVTRIQQQTEQNARMLFGLPQGNSRVA